jgi:CelD/BcsL family acetyltransferase involved in cellulose biosynthesis
MVLAARGEDGAYLGFLPLRLRTVWSQSRQRLRNEIEFAGRLFWADYGGVLCLPEHDAAVLHAFAARLKQMDWSHIFLKGFRVSERRFALFMEPFADERLIVESLTSMINQGATDNLVCPYIELPSSFEAYLGEKLSSNTRQKMRRFLRKIESESEYRITATTAETRARDLQLFENLWRNTWGSRKGTETDRLARKYRLIVERGMEGDMVYMPILWRGETAIGALASFVDWSRSRLLFFVAGRNDGFHDLPVGLVLHAHNIRWAIENGIRTYDFLRGDEAYKRSLGAAASVRLQYPLIRTKSGTNLNGGLDPGCMGEALRMAENFAERDRIHKTVTVCRQVLATMAGIDTARRLIDALRNADE